MPSKIRHLTSLPTTGLPPSALVDILHFVACDKPAVRFPLENIDTKRQILDWCQKHQFSIAYDSEGYVCIAHSLHMAQTVLSIDTAPSPHANELGLLLGYPQCCSQFIHRIGENNIDTLAELMRDWKFKKRFNLINPIGYLEGNSLICHLPCSTVCIPSLEIAEKALRFIKVHYDNNDLLTRWASWIYDY